jgi:hypothetical protein
MSLLFLAGSIAYLVGLESIIGAFLTGLILNKYITKNSAIMQNFHFIGNAVFIPIFLIYVGMLIDYQAVFNNPRTLIFSGIITISALSAKLFAAFISGKIFHYTNDEICLLFVLYASHAAVVIATALIGYNLGLINISVLNATVVLILISCIVSSYVTEFFGKKVVVASNNLISDDTNEFERIVVPYSNPNNIGKLLDIAVVASQNIQNTIFPLSIISDDDENYRNIVNSNKKIIKEHIDNHYSHSINFDHISCIDINPITGINRAVKELMGTMAVIGWTGHLKRSDVFGDNIDTILTKNDIQMLVCNLKEPVIFYKEMVVVVPENSQLEKGFKKWLLTISNINNNIAAKLSFVCRENTANIIKEMAIEMKIFSAAKFIVKDTLESFIDFSQNINKNTLLFFVLSRQDGIGDAHKADKFIRNLNQLEDEINFVIIVPERFSAGEIINERLVR